jgi:hypothetical protein
MSDAQFLIIAVILGIWLTVGIVLLYFDNENF